MTMKNKQFKGTKGKWTVKHSESKTAWNVIGTVLGGKYKVARCPYVKSPIKSDEQEAKANAMLIAAAPELLERLQKVKLMLQAHPDYVCHENGEFHDQVDSIEEVITKALKKEVIHE